MSIEYLGTVVLANDRPESGLLAGDVGAVVETYGETGVEVEFVDGAGRTVALLTLERQQVRSVAPAELLSVRTLDAAKSAEQMRQADLRLAGARRK